MEQRRGYDRLRIRTALVSASVELGVSVFLYAFSLMYWLGGGYRALSAWWEHKELFGLILIAMVLAMHTHNTLLGRGE